MADVGTFIEQCAALVGPWLAVAVALRTALQATVTVLDFVDDRVPVLAGLTSFVSGILAGTDRVVRIVGVKSLQGSGRAFLQVVTK